jgi:hypothetical protein
MTKELNVILDGPMTGRVARDTRGRILLDPFLWGFDYVGPGFGGDLAAPFRPAEIYGLSPCPNRIRTSLYNGQPIESRRPLQFGRGTEIA